MSNVYSFRGTGVPQTGIPRNSVIRTAERMLEMALSGEIQALGCIVLRSDTTAEFEISGLLGGSYALVGAGHMMLRDLENLTAGED